MKQHAGWYLPDHEEHLIGWMSHPKNASQIVDGRVMYQAVKQRKAMEHCRSFRTAVDVGGHVGLWSFYLAQRFRTVHAFEPVAEHRECFVANVPGVHTDRDVHLHACALGEADGSVSIATRATSSGDSCVDGYGDIPMIRLDDMDLQDVDFMKLDCEGYELHALHGARRTIERWNPTIIVEQKKGRAQRFGFGETDAVPFLESLGYRVAEVLSGDYILVPTIGANVIV